ncbi:MAG: hypothetical protein ACRC6I_01915 [Paracoccaceae bacterium]
MTTYLTGFAGFAGIMLAGAGLADFDPATGMIDLKPFNAYALIAAVPTLAATVVAPIALMMGWRK